MGPYRTPDHGPAPAGSASAAAPSPQSDLALGLLACLVGLLPVVAALAGGAEMQGWEVAAGLLVLLFGARVLVQGWRTRRRQRHRQS